MNNRTRKRLIKFAGGHWMALIPKRNQLSAFLFKKILKLKHDIVVGYGVVIAGHHGTSKYFQKIYETGIDVGENCHFAENTNIDTTGNVTIGNNVFFAEDTLVYTHGHHLNSVTKGNDKSFVIPNSIVIEDNVLIGARAVILNSCTHIGKGAQIGAGSVVRQNIPPYTMVIGNPAKIVGLSMTVDQILEFETLKYPEDKRMSREELEKMYQKYFLNRVKDIAKFVKQ